MAYNYLSEQGTQHLVDRVKNKLSVKIESELATDLESVNTPEYADTISELRTDINELNESITNANSAISTNANAIETNTQSILSINENLVDGLLYDTDYNLYLTANGEVISQPVKIVGGSGGGGGNSSTVIKVQNMNDSSVMEIAYGSTANISFQFTSTDYDEPTGDGTCKIVVNGATKSTFRISQGTTTVNVSPYLKAGTNDVIVTCTDINGNSKSIGYTITAINLSITSTFDDTVVYDRNVLFKYTPYGQLSKTIYFILDDVETELETSISGQQSTYDLGVLSHGTHKFEVYMTAELDGTPIESNHLYYDIMCLEEGNTTSMIASPFKAPTSISQGDLISIPYSVYNPIQLNSEVDLTISKNNEIYSSQHITVNRDRLYWNTRNYPIGEDIVFSISSNDISIEFTIDEVTSSNINVVAVTNDLDFVLSSAGRSNDESNPSTWTNNGVTVNFNNMNWISNGWIEDKNNDVVMRINGGATATINYKPFEEDLRVYGKTLEIEFSIHDVHDRSSVVVSCMNNDIGFNMTCDNARFKSEQSEIGCFYKDEEKVRISFVVESRNENRMLCVYMNGILSGAKQYPESDNFQQRTPCTITIGSEDCAIDIYTIRSYSTALSHINIKNNFIADTQDIGLKKEIYERNDIYDDYGSISYSKIKSKIPVMTIVGDLPQSKGDKKTVNIKYEDYEHPEFDFEDNCTIDVQGTSSQFYVRKNYKLKFKTVHQNTVDQIPVSVFTMKADYAEATGTHNTQAANLVETLYSVKNPAQVNNSKVRTTVYGFPCVIFHQENESSDPVFIGKYNFNSDKSALNSFGFISSYDVESWEFLNNTSDDCLFKEPLSENWTDNFEARYPEDSEAIERFRTVHDWIVSTKNNLTKFRTEFENYFNLNSVLVYYVYTFFALMVDQRAKNMFFTYWGNGDNKWYLYFYDNDTSFGINNEGDLVFDYYHEDIDQLNSANVFNGQDSVLWTNFRQAFANEIKSTYQNLRNNNKLTYDILVDYFIHNGSDKWSESIYNEDEDFKYVSMLRSDNDASNLYQIRGNGADHFKYFVDNRLNYCDSKWDASDYTNNYVSLRIYTPNTWEGVEPNANITVTPFSNMYAGVKYKANGTLMQQRAEANEEVTFIAPNETFNDTETGIYGASDILSIGDLAPLYCGSINVSKANKLTELKIGDGTDGYSNTNMTSLSVGTNALLKKIDIQNCPNLTEPLDLSHCPSIEEIYAKGSGLTGVSLPDSGYLKIIQLPSTIVNLTIKNQLHIEQLTIDGYNNIKAINIENCPTIDSKYILGMCSNVERVRMTNINWTYESADFLLSLANTASGMDENGSNTQYPVITGNCHIVTLTNEDIAELTRIYPYLSITYDNIAFKVTFKNYDGVTLCQQLVNDGENATDPITIGIIETPTKPETPAFVYTYIGWGNEVDGSVDEEILNNITSHKTVYAEFNEGIHYYTVRFISNGVTEGEVLYTTSVAYGQIATYSGTVPKDASGNGLYGWSPDIASTPIVEDTDFIALFLVPLQYTLDTTTGELRLYADNQGFVSDYSTYSSVPWYSNRAKITSVVIDDTIQNVPSYMCYGATALTSVTLPDGIKKIGSGAFRGTTALTSIELPDGLEEIGSQAFYGTKVVSLSIPNTVTKIESGAFSTSYITEITLGNNLKTIGSSAFSSTNITSISIPKGVQVDGTQLFYGCKKLTSATLGCITIVEKCFSGCTNLSYVQILNTVTSIGNNAFDSLTKLSTVEFEENSQLTTIGQYAFNGCTLLTSIDLPNSIISLGMRVFYGCTSLSYVHYPENLSYIPNYAFYNTAITQDVFETIIRNPNINTLNADVFRSPNITKIIIPDNITTMDGNEQFYSCNGATEIEIGSNIDTITGSCFAYCSSLQSVTIPSNITSIGDYAFRNCTSLTSLIMLSETPPSLGGRNLVYSGSTSYVIIVPKGSLEAYKTATNWSSYASKMREADE